MREKSSRVLTSLSSRKALRWALSSASPLKPSEGLLQGLLERTQQQGQRGPKFVRHVREEGGLRAIDFCQRLGACALRLVGLGIGNRGGELPDDEIEESSISIVQRAARRKTRR